MCRILEFGDMDALYGCGDDKHVVFASIEYTRSAKFNTAAGVGDLKSQYRTVLSHVLVTIMGDSEFGKRKKRSARIEASWIPTVCGGPPLAARSRSQPVLSAPAPATFWPS